MMIMTMIQIKNKKKLIKSPALIIKINKIIRQFNHELNLKKMWIFFNKFNTYKFIFKLIIKFKWLENKQ